MCGIAGEFVWGGGKARPLDLNKIAHRGPDARGEWTSHDEGCWLGHTRLSIVDLSPNGAQPMVDPVSGNVIVFNGEVYNHQELRKELEVYNPSYRGMSDTETLLVGYRHWKERLLDKAKGMFAFVIYDASDQSLFVARDRLGIKWLHFIQEGNRFTFASETRILNSIDRPVVTPMGVSAYLQWGAVPSSDVLFTKMTKFPKGHWMRVSRDGRTKLHRYWPALIGFYSSSLNAAQKVRELLDASVREHLMADVPIASLLSGGIDSSIITALAARHSEGNLQTFSVGFKEEGFDETSIAEMVARRYKCKHERIELPEAETLALVREGLDKMDLPSVDAINTYIVCRKIADRGIKVGLSGLGGDELFGGYPSFRDVPLLKHYAHLPPFLKQLCSLLGRTGRRLAEVPDMDVSSLALWRRRFWTDEMLDQAGLPTVSQDITCHPDVQDDFAAISWVELTTYMHYLLLRDSDQMSMACSLELRVPFLDHVFVEYMLGLSEKEKQRYPGVKGLLVESCKDLLPPEVYMRPKRGFELPMRSWMMGPLAGLVSQGLDACIEFKVLREDVIRTLKNKFDADRMHWTRLWALVVLGHYLNRNSAKPA